MTHTGSFLLKSTGFDIGDHIAIALMLWKHLYSSGVHWKVQLFCANPDYSAVYAVTVTHKTESMFGAFWLFIK